MVEDTKVYISHYNQIYIQHNFKKEN